MGIDCYIAAFLSALILFLAMYNERADFGCQKKFGVSGASCADENSVYARGTKYQAGDAAETIKTKLKSLFGHHERAGVWKRCVVTAFMTSVVGYVVYVRGSFLDGHAAVPRGWLFLITWLVTFSILYFVKNFENFHIYRVLQRHGLELISHL